MNITRKIILILLLLGLFIVSVHLTQVIAATSYAAEDGSTVYVVVITDKKLKGVTGVNPAIIRIKTGDSIEWKNEDDSIHFIKSKAGEGGLRFKAKMIKQGEKWKNKFTKPGTYNYYCALHSQKLSGMIIVGVDPSEEMKVAEVKTKAESLAPPREDLIEARSYKAEDGSKVHIVVITDKKIKGFSELIPAILHIKTGESIEWVNEDKRVHFINSKLEFAGFGKKAKKGSLWFNSKYIKMGDKYIVKFTKPGTSKYFCFTHPIELSGKITVEGEPLLEVREAKVKTEETLKEEPPLKEKETVPTIAEEGSTRVFRKGKTHIVNIPEESKVFVPAVLTIKAGDTIRWTNNDHSIEAHKFASVPGPNPENKELKITILEPGKHFEHTFLKEGEYLYFCFIHQGMVGNIIVKAVDDQ